MLTREIILTALHLLSDRLRDKGVVGEINTLGGTAMVLACRCDFRASGCCA
jgi:hypothetical protein